jgi:hypothetical protein
MTKRSWGKGGEKELVLVAAEADRRVRTLSNRQGSGLDSAPDAHDGGAKRDCDRWRIVWRPSRL